MYVEAGKVYNSDEDQCHKCKHLMRCPLITALVTGFAHLSEDEVIAEDCPMFEKKERHLSVVPDE